MTDLNVTLGLNPAEMMSDSKKDPFQLRPEYFVPAKMPLNLIFPRPNGETQSHARHRKYHSQMRYQIPIGVQGGAWPFKYELVAGPTGTAIGQYYGQNNYGVITWTPSGQTGTQTFTVLVTDQEGSTLTITWTATLDDSAFVFIQDGYAGTKIGTITQPLEDVEDWYLNSPTNSTYHNKIIVFRGGNYLATGNSAAHPTNIALDISYKTPTLIGFPDEVPVIDCQYCKFDDVSGIDDIFISGITFRNARNDQSNAQFFVIGGYSDRVTFWKCEFREIAYGTVGNDNCSPIFSSNPGVDDKDYFLLKHCTFDQVNTHAGNGSYVDLYKTNHILIEENVAKNSNTTYGFWEKASISYVTMRANIAVDNVRGSQFSIALGGASAVVPHHKEMCWNIGRTPSDSTVLLFAYSGNTVWAGQYYDMWCYRNTAIGQAAGVFDHGLEPTYTDGNIFAVDSTTNLVLNNTGAIHPDIVVTRTSPILDSNGLLTGATGYATHGGEVY